MNIQFKQSARKKNEVHSSHLHYSFSLLGIGSIMALGILSLVTFCPVVEKEVKAEEAEIKPFSATVNTDVSSYVRSSIAVSITGKADLDLVPASTGTFSQSSDIKLSVTTNNTSGYEVYLTTVDQSGSLVRRSPLGEVSQIKPITGSMSATNFTEHLDSWGYSVIDSNNTDAVIATSSGEFVAIPDGGGSVIKTEATSSDDQYTLRFGAAVSPSLPAGVYTNTVVASVVANPIEVRSLSDITTMQQMTPEICAISFENETKQLTDERDGKSYWVAKLADGNCWMTQNLALDIYNDNGVAKAIPDGANPENITSATKLTTLDQNNTNIPETWSTNSTRCMDYPGDYYCAASSTVNHLTNTAIPAYPNASGTHSWNLGKNLAIAPLLNSECPVVSDTESTSLAAQCAANGIIDVSGAEWQPSFTAQKGYWKYDPTTKQVNATVSPIAGTTETLITADTTAKTYDPHYLFGNYYQFNAAMAGYSGVKKDPNGTIIGANNTKWGAISHSDIEYNICPRGWTTSTSANSPEEITGPSFYALYKAYDITTKPSNGNYNIYNAPLYNTKNGMLYPEANDTTSLKYIGSGFALWNRRATNQTSPFSAGAIRTFANGNELYTYGHQVTSVNANQGIAIRCLAK